MPDVENASRLFLTGMELLRLNDCGTSTRYGQVDQGFPATMLVLEGKGLVKAKDKGYIITELGLLTLRQYQKELRTI